MSKLTVYLTSKLARQLAVAGTVLGLALVSIGTRLPADAAQSRPAVSPAAQAAVRATRAAVEHDYPTLVDEQFAGRLTAAQAAIQAKGEANTDRIAGAPPAVFGATYRVTLDELTEATHRVWVQVETPAGDISTYEWHVVQVGARWAVGGLDVNPGGEAVPTS